MKEYSGNHFIINGDIKEVDQFNNSLVFSGDTIYEVIRMVRGTPVFFEEHFQRLKASVRNIGKSIIADNQTVKNSIRLLADADKRKEINIKIVFNYNEDAENWLLYYIDSNYPSDEQYRKGVKGILFYAERKDPQSKILNYRMRSAIHQELAEEEAYEALLVNEKNQITEGSKSNVFFMKKGKLITAPDEVILKGVTRKHIIEICSEEGVEIEYSCVDADDLQQYESAFMTGTSPMVLPYYCINEFYFDVRLPLLQRLRSLYMKRVEDSMNRFNSEI